MVAGKRKPLRVLKPRLSPMPPRVGKAPGAPRTTAQRDQDAPWRPWYRTKRWQDLRIAVFARDLFICQWQGCGASVTGKGEAVCDHKLPHRGNASLFWDIDNLQTLCTHCHSTHKQRVEQGESYQGFA